MNGMLTLSLANSDAAARTAENDLLRTVRHAQADRRAAAPAADTPRSRFLFKSLHRRGGAARSGYAH